MIVPANMTDLERMMFATLLIEKQEKAIALLSEENKLLKARIQRLTNPQDFNLQAPVPALLRKQI